MLEEIQKLGFSILSRYLYVDFFQAANAAFLLQRNLLFL